MEFDIFHEFVVLATYGSFVSAARELNISQPTLSRHIGAFEKQLKRKLLFDTRPLSLTPAGEVVLQCSGKLIHDYHNMLIELEKMPSSKNERVVIQDSRYSSALFIGINEAIKMAHEEFGSFQLDYAKVDKKAMSSWQFVERDTVDISFEPTLNTDEVPALGIPEGMRAIFIPEFHSELITGIPLDSPLATKEDLCLKDFAYSRFILQMNRVSEKFTEDFNTLCEEEGFYPNISYVPSKSAFDFYSADPKGGIHLLGAGNQEYKPLTYDLIKKYAVLRSFTDKTYYCNAFAVTREKCTNSVLSFIIKCLEERAERYIRENKLERQEPHNKG